MKGIQIWSCVKCLDFWVFKLYPI